VAQPVLASVPAAPVIPVAEPVAPVTTEEAETNLAFEAASDVLVAAPRRRRGRRWPWKAIVVVLLLSLGAGAVVWAGIYFWGWGADEEQIIEEANCRFRAPGRPWHQDKTAQGSLGVNLALRRGSTGNGLALYFHDYATHAPRDAELVDDAVLRLSGYFKRLEYELKPRNDATRLGGRSARELEFVGLDGDSVQVSGVCLLTAHRGVAYLFFTWGPIDDRESLLPDWEELRGRFAILNGREGWKELLPESVPVRGNKLGYRLDPAKPVWRPVPTDGYDPLADVVLFGNERAGVKSAGKAATLEVLLLPKADDLKTAVETAKAHYLKRQRDPQGENYSDTVVAPVTDKEGKEVSRDVEIDGTSGHVAKLHVINGENRERYVVMAVLPRPEGVVVLKGDCDWGRRDYWEQEFAAAIGTFRVVKDR
jgi:hypothetical protein